MAVIDITERQAGDVTILDMNGKVTIGDGSVALRSKIRELLADGKNKILLNLG
jgi:anti-sigma B factor antagonist